MIGYTVAIIAVVNILLMLTMLTKFYRKVKQGQALVRNGIGGTRVSFSGMIVIPVLHQAEIMDISAKRVTISLHRPESLICRDHQRADITAVFLVRVNNTEEDVLKAAQRIGCDPDVQEKALQDMFEAKLSVALKIVGKQFDLAELYNYRERFMAEVLKNIGTDLNGFVIDDLTIDFPEQEIKEKY